MYVSDLISGARTPLLALCMAVTAMGAVAATDAQPKAATKKTPLLTRDELRVCMTTQAKRQQDRDALVETKAKLDAEKAELVTSGQALKDQLASLDRTNEELVAKYVEANAAREKRIDEFEKSSNEFNARVQAAEAADVAYKKDCADRRYDEKDELAIKKGK
jgi:septal ring factor EnvC (AmiA/AmiB activator)